MVSVWVATNGDAASHPCDAPRRRCRRCRKFEGSSLVTELNFSRGNPLQTTPDRTTFRPKGAPAPATMDDLPGLDAMDFGLGFFDRAPMGVRTVVWYKKPDKLA